MNLKHGDKKRVDHIDGNGLNNSKSTNLRIATHSQNMHNKHIKGFGSSDYKGVSKNKNNSFIVKIEINKKQTHIGTFKDEIEAAHVYDAVLRYELKEFGIPNFDEIHIEPMSIETARNKYKRYKIDKYATK